MTKLECYSQNGCKECKNDISSAEKELFRLQDEMKMVREVIQEHLSLLDKQELEFRRRFNYEMADRMFALSAFLKERLASIPK